jgi:hypothetical protein
MNPNDQNENQMALDIEKRRVDTEAEIYKIINAILRKNHSMLTQEDKGFLQARRDYLTDAQRDDYKKELSENLDPNAVQSKDEVPSLALLTRRDLEAKAKALGIMDPSTKAYKKNEDLIKAIEDLQD